MIEHTFYRIGMLVLKFMRWAKKLKGFFLEQKKNKTNFSRYRNVYYKITVIEIMWYYEKPSVILVCDKWVI